MKMIGIDSKAEVTEDGKILKLYWGDTFYSAIFKEYSGFTRSLIEEYIGNSSKKIASFISFCDVEDYEKCQHDNGHFVLSIDAFLKGESLQKDACSYISKRFKDSDLLKELKEIEGGLISSEKAADEILQF